MKETVCITGGSGGIGRTLFEHLIDRYHVKALFRARCELTDEWAGRGATPVFGDIANEAALDELVSGTTLVFHCAALTQGPYDALHAVNVEGTARLARAAAAAGCRRFVYVSSVAVYSGLPDQSDYTEDLTVADDEAMAAYARTKVQSERVLADIARAQRLDYTILRPTCVYGPEVKSFTLVPIGLISKGMTAIVGDGNGFMDVVHVDDVARALVLAGESPQASGETFNIGDRLLTLNDYYAHYGTMLNRPVRHLPMAVVNGVGRVLRMIPGNGFSGLRQGVKFLSRMSANVQRYPSDKAKSRLGYEPAVKLPIGMLDVALWGRRRKLVPSPKLSIETYGPGPAPFQPAAVVHPDSEADLIRIVALARREGMRVKAIGSLHSLSRIPETDGICVVLDRYNGLVTVDGPLVTVQAGMKLHALNEALAAHGLAMPILGAITQQTVAGAISTSTHGGSLFFGSLSDQVEALRIVRADGTIVDLHRSDPSFDGAAVSLGVLGILSTVTVRCAPAFVLRSRSSVRNIAEVLGDFDVIHRGNTYVDMLYYPGTGDVEMVGINRLPADAAFEPEHDQDHLAVMPEGFLNSGAGRRGRALAAKAIFGTFVRRPQLHNRMVRRSVGSSYLHRTGRSDRVLAFGDGGTIGRSPFEMMLQGMEAAVPYERAVAALEALRDFLKQSRKTCVLPVHIRCSPQSSLWMSPAFGRDVCWLEFWLYPHANSLSADDIHTVLAPFGYRFHWGKSTHVDRAYIRAQYPRWDDFCALRATWDPGAMFMNRYLEAFFDVAPGIATK